MNIGQKIKELRIQKSLTQEELADRAELSKGFISQLERDLTSPSIATLVDILQCLGTNLEEFFSGTTSEQVVFKKTDYFEKYDAELKNLVKWIIPNAQKNIMEPILLTLDPGGSTYPDNPHEGEEFGYVISGNITLHIGNISYKAKKVNPFILLPINSIILLPPEKHGATLLWVSTTVFNILNNKGETLMTDNKLINLVNITNPTAKMSYWMN